MYLPAVSLGRLISCSLIRKHCKHYKPLYSLYKSKIVQNKYNFNYIQTSYISTTYLLWEKEKKTENQKVHEKRIALTGYFNIQDRNRETFLATLDLFKEKEKHLRGYVEFIYASLEYMKDFGVEHELEVYKKLLDLMPKGKMIATNQFQAMFMHYPRQQQCAIDVLEKMERSGVMGDSEMEQILLNTFGVDSHPVKKFRRIMYWFPKFKYASPWNLPSTLPNDALELAKLAVERMCSVDPTSKLQVLQTEDIEDSLDKTWVVSGQSPVQQKLLEQHPTDIPIKVEGPFRIYLRKHLVTYFILRSDYVPLPPPPDDPDDVTSFFTLFNEDDEKHSLAVPLSVHQQDDGTIYGICATGTSSRDSTLSWIRLLEATNPSLKNIPILFEQSSPLGPVLQIDRNTDDNLPEQV